MKKLLLACRQCGDVSQAQAMKQRFGLCPVTSVIGQSASSVERSSSFNCPFVGTGMSERSSEAFAAFGARTANIPIPPKRAGDPQAIDSSVCRSVELLDRAQKVATLIAQLTKPKSLVNARHARGCSFSEIKKPGPMEELHRIRFAGFH